MYIMLYIMPAYLMLSAALFNDVSLLLISLPLTFANALYFHAMPRVIDK